MFCCLPSLQFYIIFQSHYLFNRFQNRAPSWLLYSFSFQLGFHEMEINPFGKLVSFLVRGNRVITCGVAVQQSEAALLDVDDYALQLQATTRKAREQQILSRRGCDSTCPLIVAHAQQININGLWDLHHHSSKYGKIMPLIYIFLRIVYFIFYQAFGGFPKLVSMAGSVILACLIHSLNHF